MHNPVGLLLGVALGAGKPVGALDRRKRRNLAALDEFADLDGEPTALVRRPGRSAGREIRAAGQEAERQDERRYTATACFRPVFSSKASRSARSSGLISISGERTKPPGSPHNSIAVLIMEHL